jgi:hypothetical protein
MLPVEWCERCGADLVGAEQGLPCHYCWEATADDVLVAELAASASEALASDDARARIALKLLSQIDDPRAAGSLRGLVEKHSEPRVRAAALHSLGWSGDEADVPLALRALDAGEIAERMAAIGALGELGGSVAADALAGRLEFVDGDEMGQVVAALAWLRDPRALEPARRLATVALDDYHRNDRNVIWALVRVGDDADRELLWQRVAALPDSTAQRNAVWTLRNAFALEDPSGVPASAGAMGIERRPGASPQTFQPLAPRVVPRLTLDALLDEPPGSDGPQAKFGGQPDWIGTPTWPHTRGGRPLMFFGQLPLPGQPRRMSYIFIGPDDSWKPLGEGNAVVVQPGPAPPHIACRPRATGPAIYEPAAEPPGFRPLRRYRAYERFVSLTEGADPERWEWPEAPPGVYRRDEHGDWNKIGGTGCWLQGEPDLPGDGWAFAFQFTASWAGRELADGAECYGFLRGDGTAALAWDCH